MPLLRLIYAGLLLVAVIFLWQAQQFPGPLSRRDIGPAVFPQWLAGAIVVLCSVGLVVGWRSTPRVPWNEVALPLLVGGGVAAAVWLATLFGFFVVLPFVLFAGLWLAGSRQWVANGLFSLLLPLGTWVIFVKLLGLPLVAL